MANAVGRPLKFATPEELDDKIEAYFNSIIPPNDIATITGLAVYLDTSRQTLIDYKEREEFTDSIKKALARCESQIEKRAMLGGLNPAMSIFTLKNNYGWKDKTEQDITSNGKTVSQPVDANMLTQFLLNIQENTKR